MTLKEAEEIYIEAQNEYTKQRHIGINKPTYQEMEKHLEPYTEKVHVSYRNLLNSLSKEDDILLEPLDTIGLYMSIEEFKECCLAQGFIDYDGNGVLCIGKQQSTYSIYPSMICDPLCNLSIFDGVMWYNK